MPGRSFSSGSYRYGFQGQEKDDEVKGDGNSINYKYRVHDPRIGKFLSIDPLTKNYPWNSPYTFSENRVIDAVELEGLESYVITNTYGDNGEINSIGIYSYRDENGTVINQNLTNQNTGTNYSDFQGLIVNINAPQGIPQYQGVNDISNVNLTGTNKNSVDYSQLVINSNRRVANFFGVRRVSGGVNFSYFGGLLSNIGNEYKGTGTSSSTYERFSYALDRQRGVSANFGRNSALFTFRGQILANRQAQNIADWLKIFNNENYRLTGNVAGGYDNDDAIGDYTNELGIFVASRAGVAGSPGTAGGLKLARASAYRNLIVGFGINGSRVTATMGIMNIRNVVGQFW
jgi:RHS repeat-associated protein